MDKEKQKLFDAMILSNDTSYYKFYTNKREELFKIINKMVFDSFIRTDLIDINSPVHASLFEQNSKSEFPFTTDYCGIGTLNTNMKFGKILFPDKIGGDYNNKI